MKAVVFSGTTEGRRFSRRLAGLGAEVIVCVATPLGAEEQGEMAGITVHAGRLEPDAMAALLAGADLCIDATHPYAVDATKNIRAAAAQAGVEYSAGGKLSCRDCGQYPAGHRCQGAGRFCRP